MALGFHLHGQGQNLLVTFFFLQLACLNSQMLVDNRFHEEYWHFDFALVKRQYFENLVSKLEYELKKNYMSLLNDICNNSASNTVFVPFLKVAHCLS